MFIHNNDLESTTRKQLIWKIKLEIQTFLTFFINKFAQRKIISVITFSFSQLFSSNTNFVFRIDHFSSSDFIKLLWIEQHLFYSFQDHFDQRRDFKLVNKDRRIYLQLHVNVAHKEKQRCQSAIQVKWLVQNQYNYLWFVGEKCWFVFVDRQW